MKRILFILALSLALFSCDKVMDNPVVEAGDGTGYHIEEIDGCQYVYRKSGNTGFMAHKGNCSNPIHEHNK